MPLKKTIRKQDKGVGTNVVFPLFSQHPAVPGVRTFAGAFETGKFMGTKQAV